MRLLIVGAGATGGYFGGRLAEAGRDVTFLVRPRRAARLAQDGLRIASPHGDVTLTPRVITADAIDGPYDAVILAVKAYALERALTDLAPAVGPETIVVPLLNGLRHLDAMDSCLGASRVVGGVCIVATTLESDGRIRQLGPMQELIYGERDGSVSERLRSLDATLQGAGFKARLSENVLQDMWEKWVMLSALGTLTCLLRGTVGEIEAVPGGAAIARRVLAETSAVAAASGYAPREAHAARVGSMLTEKGSAFASSMYRDLQGGDAVEVEHILADLLDRATGFGHDAPLLAAAVAQLRVYANRRDRD